MLLLLAKTKFYKIGFLVADYSAQAIVNNILFEYFPNDPIVGEEDSNHLRSSEGKDLAKRITELANSVLKNEITLDQVNIL